MVFLRFALSFLTLCFAIFANAEPPCPKCDKMTAVKNAIQVQMALCENNLKKSEIICSQIPKNDPKYICNEKAFCDSDLTVKIKQDYDCFAGLVSPTLSGIKAAVVFPFELLYQTSTLIYDCSTEKNCGVKGLSENQTVAYRQNLNMYFDELKEIEVINEIKLCQENRKGYGCPVPEVTCREWDEYLTKGKVQRLIDFKANSKDGFNKGNFCKEILKRTSAELDVQKNSQARAAAKAVQMFMTEYAQRWSCYRPEYQKIEACKALGAAGSVISVPLLLVKALQLARLGLNASAIFGKLKTDKEYVSIEIPDKEFKSHQIAKSTRLQKEQLDEMGVQYRRTDDLSYFRDLFLDGEVKKPKGSAGYRMMGEAYGEQLQITKLPMQKGQKSPFASALTHPDMPEYLENLEKMGYKLNVDTSIPYTGTGGYFDPNKKFIAIKPEMKWHEFIHEFQHAEFDKFVKSEFSDMKAEVNFGNSLQEAVSKKTISDIGEGKLKRIEELLKKGLTESTSINETLSVEAELKAMGLKQYIPKMGSKYEKYALTYQINDLKNLKKSGVSLSAIQQKTLDEAIKRHDKILPTRDKLVTAAEYGAYAASSAVSVPLIYQTLENANAEKIFYDGLGRIFGITKDKKIIYIDPNHK